MWFASIVCPCCSCFVGLPSPFQPGHREHHWYWGLTLKLWTDPKAALCRSGTGIWKLAFWQQHLVFVIYWFCMVLLFWLFAGWFITCIVIPMCASVSRSIGGRSIQGGKWVIHKYDATLPKAVCSKGRAAVKTNHHSAGCGQVRGYWGDIVNGQGTQDLWKALPRCVRGCTLKKVDLMIGWKMLTRW